MAPVIPSLLPPMSLADYFNRYQTLYIGKPIALPEGPNVIFSIDRTDPHHPICGKFKSPVVDPTRAKRLEWIGMILKNQATRTVYICKRNKNIIFHAPLLGHVIVCSKFKNGKDFRFVTHYHASSKKFNSPEYELYKW